MSNTLDPKDVRNKLEELASRYDRTTAFASEDNRDPVLIAHRLASALLRQLQDVFDPPTE